MKIRHLVGLTLLATVILSGCSKDDCNRNHPADQLGLPAIEQGTFPESDITLNVGDTYDFAPKVLTPGPVYYQWYFNSEDVSTDPFFKLLAKRPMRSSLSLTMSNDNGRVTLENKIIVSGADYRGKYLVVNEGWFGPERGSITAYDPSDNSIEEWAFKNQNFGTALGVTSQSATIWNDKLYICSKQSNSLTVVDPNTLYVEQQSGSLLGTRQPYEFVGIDEQYGILTANADIYRIDLGTLDAKQILMSDSYNGCGSGIVWQNKLIVNVKGKKLHVLELDKITGDLSGYNWSNYFPFTTIDVTTSGGCRFVKAADGNLYTIESNAGTNNLVRIKPDWSVEKKAVRSDYRTSDFGAYREATFCGSGTDNNFFYVAGGKIYKCSFDDPAPVTPFTDYSKDGYGFYGAGIRVNPANGEVVATYLTSDYYNNLLVRFDGTSGELIAEKQYAHYWFPATIIFNN